MDTLAYREWEWEILGAVHLTLELPCMSFFFLLLLDEIQDLRLGTIQLPGCCNDLFVTLRDREDGYIYIQNPLHFAWSFFPISQLLAFPPIKPLPSPTVAAFLGIYI